MYQKEISIFFTIVFFVVSLFFSGHVKGQDKIEISSDFPGGNIVINKISQDTVWLKSDLSFTEGDWFYWYFKASNISGKKITFCFEQKNAFTKYGPAYSLNNDYTWKWYGENRIENNCFTYSFSEQDTTVYFCLSFPYTGKHLNGFILDLNNKELLSVDTLCLSPEKRVIEKITISPSITKPSIKVLITARHHSCEMIANYVLEGIIESVLNEKNLEYLRENVEFLIVPFMDKDGVENGEQGKNRIPRDHNRDYNNKSVYNSTAALRVLIPEWSEGKLEIALDMHCPWIRGKGNEYIYLVGNSTPVIEKEQVSFSKLLEKNSFGEMKYYHKNFLPYGVSWNNGKNYISGMSFGKWASTLEGISLSATLEVPYANISGVQVSKDGARVFGKTIAYSIKEYLKSIE
jgi:hypothetical protein